LDDGSNDILAFALSAETVDLWLHPDGCESVDNGVIVAANQGVKAGT